MIADSRRSASSRSENDRTSKAAIESEKNAAMAELKLQVSTLSLSIAEKLLKDVI
jgi:F-type H+-transporting ATPase subunit b